MRLLADWHKMVIAFVGLCHLWDKSTQLTDFFKRFKIERRNAMVNPVTIIEGINALETAMPVVIQAVGDVKAAIAAKKDPTAEVAALEKVIADVQTLFAGVSGLVKPPAAASPAASAPPATPAS